MDNLNGLREIKWCDHAGVSLNSAFTGRAHVSVMHHKAVHIVVEDGIVKIICHSCFVHAMQVGLYATKAS